MYDSKPGYEITREIEHISNDFKQMRLWPLWKQGKRFTKPKCHVVNFVLLLLNCNYHLKMKEVWIRIHPRFCFVGEKEKLKAR